MSNVLSSVDARTQLVGQNRLELLLFHLGGQQYFAINVFKVQEVMRLPDLTKIPDSHPCIRGVCHVRGQTVPVVDLRAAVKMGPMTGDTSNCNIIVTEYNMTIQAFLVGGVDRIVNMNWNEILPPPGGAGRQHYLTAITRIDERIVEIIDVEKVLAEISPYELELTEDAYDRDLLEQVRGKDILIVDDSNVALEQMKNVIAPMGLNIVQARNGLEAYQTLMHWKQEGRDIRDRLLMIITDAEMPEMDGYMLTTEIRQDPELKDTFVILHTSLSGNFNKAMVEKVGCDGFLSKFKPHSLAEEVQKLIRMKVEQSSAG
ncbi:MAG: chemotaxis protein CheV [Thalassolituus sp.]|jgi:two-component system chemotaxis response regulator CheV|uniref:chemotaxis protein CheV n=1 Tax=unclassified Thalassolituus TaxID=2624967 RepID=UPI000C0DE71B|nr:MULTISPECIES: chemotaxis protein CheV [unclassified Thalassolituus]MBN58885.1 chemotaxis protein CheW [Oceanospirillaceae bacterium]MDQ4423512.1 chemotaxis protein CheV [Thalassolituus sp.]MDQ4424863.1 chemotaxis protein CheV [Thalassolituus sp.]|tara:strand:+ start:703 stop:1650 length:948 start_codon:yes stop_codon:yes gene_type:complete